MLLAVGRTLVGEGTGEAVAAGVGVTLSDLGIDRDHIQMNHVKLMKKNLVTIISQNDEVGCGLSRAEGK